MTLPAAVKRISDTVWELPVSYKPGMLVPARIYATEKLVREMDAGVFEQVTNVACLPGIVRYAFCMPDGHWGYGFPIGGVAAMDPETGVISPGGIGFDINCGMRLVLTNLTVEEKISLSGRFGIWVPFHPFSQDLYVEVVRRWMEKMCAKRGVGLPWTKEARDEAILWSQRKGDRSGRIAYQFAGHWVGKELLRREPVA